MDSMTKRPRSLSEVSRRVLHEDQKFGPCFREFLDSFYTMNNDERRVALMTEPEIMNPIKDAYVAAAAEELARKFDLPEPEWVDNPDRFLEEPYFATDFQSLKATLIKESPIGFRRRLIFVSEDALYRPRLETQAPKP